MASSENSVGDLVLQMKNFLTTKTHTDFFN